ncbi:uncharacterized protein LOC114149890 [Xiphophorus couchianus]|uniref:uncharacterized protein LOC114149890 n=1 Tax=Xiphophorus couchianus TaxID=32473 RepID=UPI0010166261|nr:uncharacterized protein LOC114149890 [Xiphophorus couchianus]
MHLFTSDTFSIRTREPDQIRTREPDQNQGTGSEPVLSVLAEGAAAPGEPAFGPGHLQSPSEESQAGRSQGSGDSRLPGDAAEELRPVGQRVGAAERGSGQGGAGAACGPDRVRPAGGGDPAAAGGNQQHTSEPPQVSAGLCGGSGHVLRSVSSLHAGPAEGAEQMCELSRRPPAALRPPTRFRPPSRPAACLPAPRAPGRPRFCTDYDAHDARELSLLADEVITVYTVQEWILIGWLDERGNEKGKVPVDLPGAAKLMDR